MEKLLEVYCT